MTKKVLDVGQCNPDHSSITQFLNDQFEANVVRAHLFDDAIEQLKQDQFDLVLVNRLLDRDHSEGSDLIKAMQADPAFRTTPIMLVSNFEDAQTAAVGLGAVPGFGKNAILNPTDDQADLISNLGQYLS